MRGEVDKGDGLTVALRDFDGGGKKFGDGIVELYFAMLDHVREKQRGKNFGFGADFEDGVAVEGARVAFFKMAIGDDAAAVGVDDADDDGDALVLGVDAVDEHLVNFGVGGYGGVLRSLCGGEDGWHGDEGHEAEEFLEEGIGGVFE